MPTTTTTTFPRKSTTKKKEEKKISPSVGHLVWFDARRNMGVASALEQGSEDTLEKIPFAHEVVDTEQNGGIPLTCAYNQEMERNTDVACIII